MQLAIAKCAQMPEMHRGAVALRSRRMQLAVAKCDQTPEMHLGAVAVRSRKGQMQLAAVNDVLTWT